MGVIIRQSLKSTIVSYIGVLIGTINTIFLFTRFLSAEEIGLTRTLFENALLFTALAQLGVPYIVDRFFPYFRDEEKKHSGFFFFLLIYPLIGLLVFSVLYIFSKGIFIYYYQEKSAPLIQYFYYVLPIVFFSVYHNIVEAYSKMHFRIVVPTIIREVYLKLSNSVLIIIYACNLVSFEHLVLLMVLCYGLAPFLLVLYIYHLQRLYLTIDFSVFRHRMFRHMVVHGIYIILGGLGYIFAMRIDFLMVPALAGLTSSGIYSTSVFIAGVLEVPKRSISQISTPILSQAIRENNRGKIDEIYKKTSLNLLIIGAYIFLEIWCNIDALFNLIPNAEIYRQGKYVVFFIALARLIDMSSGSNNEIILNSRYYRFAVIATIILAGLTITTNLLFIPLYGITGAAIAIVISIFIYTIIKVIYVWIRFRLQPFTVKTGVPIILATFIYGIQFLLPKPGLSFRESLTNIILRSLLITILFVTSLLKLRISEDVNSIVSSVYDRMRKFLHLRKK